MESAHPTHGESLWERLDVLRDAGSHGAKTCSAMALFLKERAALENAYGEALIKVSKRAAKGIQPGGSAWGQTAPPPVWAPSLVQEGWAGVVASINSWGKQHIGWAHCIDQNIAKALTEFSERHKGHVARLWAEAQELVSDMGVVQGEYYRAKDAYEQACIQATRVIDVRDKARHSASSAARAAAEVQEAEMALRGTHPPLAPSSPSRAKEAGHGSGSGSMLLSLSNMLEKVGEGVVMAVSKAAGDLSLVELEEKVPEALQRVDLAESEYIASIMAVNGYTTEFQPEMEAKLKHFKLLEESRIMHVRDALLRLDQASKGMLECLLGPGGTLEALSIALSRVDDAQDAWAQLLFVRELSGMPPVPEHDENEDEERALPGEESTDSGSDGSGADGSDGVVRGQGVEGPEREEEGDAWRQDGGLLDVIFEARERTGKEILELPEGRVERAFEGTREGTTEAVRIVHEIFYCLGEVVSVEESHTRDMLRFLERQGYGSRVAQSRLGGNRASIDLHAIGATMEGVGKNVMANMSNMAGTSVWTSVCAGVMSAEGKTLTSGWDASAVNKILVSVEAHTGLTHSLANGSCSVALKAHNEAKAMLKQFNKLFASGSKQLVASKTAHARAVSRYDKVAKEVSEREETLAKARSDLNTEVQAAGGASTVLGRFSASPLPSPFPSPFPSPVPSPPTNKGLSTPYDHDHDNSSSMEQRARSRAPSSDGSTGDIYKTGKTPSDRDVSTPMSYGGGASVRRDGPWMLESLGLGHQPTAGRVRALEAKLAALVQEREAAKQAVTEATQAMEAALDELRRTVKDITLTCFAEDSNRHAGLNELLAGVLSAMLESARVLAAEQARAESLKTVERIDGRKDVEELVERNVHRAPGSGAPGRGRGDGMGEVMFMAYHSEVLQRERDLCKRNGLSPRGTQEGEGEGTQEGEPSGDGNGMVRRAGGGGHPLFTAMAEAALAQAHAKQQRRQISALAVAEVAAAVEAAQDSAHGYEGPEAGDADAAARAQAQAPGARSQTDGEDLLPSVTRSRYRRRYRRFSRGTQASGADCLSDSEVLICDDSLSRHGGSLHGLIWRGSRHGSAQGSRHGPLRQYSKHGSSKSLRNGSKHGRAKRQPHHLRHPFDAQSSNTQTSSGRCVPPRSGLRGTEFVDSSIMSAATSGKGEAGHETTATDPPRAVARQMIETADEVRNPVRREGKGGEAIVQEQGQGQILQISESGVATPTTSADAIVQAREDTCGDKDKDVIDTIDAKDSEPLALVEESANMDSPEEESEASLQAGRGRAEANGAAAVVLAAAGSEPDPGTGVDVGVVIRRVESGPSDEQDVQVVRSGEESPAMLFGTGKTETAAATAPRPPTETVSFGVKQDECIKEEDPAPTEETMAPTEEPMAPTEEPMVPTEESVAPTEESVAPTEKLRVMAPAEESGPGMPADAPKIFRAIVLHHDQIGQGERRPSLRSLKHRLNQQENFSSADEEEEDEVVNLSSSGDERPSELEVESGSSKSALRSPSPADSDTGAGVGALYRDMDLAPRVRVEQQQQQLHQRPAVKQASEELSSLKGFDLPAEALRDKVIESYSSVLYTGGGLPLHGRLYVTAKYALFSGWRNTKVVLPLSEVVSVEKTSTLIMVINALTLVKRDGKRINFGAFLFRDDCYNLLTRLVNVSSSISRLGGASADADDTLATAPPGVPPPERTIDLLANADMTDSPDHEDVSSEPPESARDVAIEHALAAPVTKLSDGNHLETLLEAVLPCTVAQVFSWLWGQNTTFWEDFLRAQGETGLSVSRWSKAGQRSGVDRDERGLEDLFPGETFHGRRELTFTHPRTGFVVGPKKVVTKQAQGYRLERRPVRPEGLTPPLDRLLVFQTTQMERGAPLADHFSILGRVVVTREPPDQDRQPRCRLEIGFNVAFHKSTFLRGAIRSGALEETSATWKSWLATSRKVIAYQRYRLGDATANEGIASPPPADVHKIAEAFSIGERFPDAAETGAGGDEVVAAAVEMKATTNTVQVSGLVDVMRALAGFAVRMAKAKTTRVPTAWTLVFCLLLLMLFLLTIGVPTARNLVFCLLLLMVFLLLLVVAVQQRDLRRLAFQVEELAAAVGELRVRIDGER